MIPMSSAVPVILASALALAPASSHAQGSLEFPVKATFLYKFAAFVDWPTGAFDSDFSPLVLCVVGDDPFGQTLEDSVAGESVKQRRIIIERYDSIGGSEGCHIMYIAGSSRQSASAAVDKVRDEPVLTVTDEATDPDVAGIIHFVVIQNRVRFEIDDAAAAAAGLTISSKLLDLAR